MTPEERRRRIEAVVEERGDVDLDELQVLLARSGVDVDEATLVGDLDALGYEVDDEEPPAPAVDEPVEADPASVDAPVVVDERAPDAPEGSTRDDEAPVAARASADDADPDGPVAAERPRAVLVMVAAAAVLIAIAVVMVVVGGEDDADDPVTAPGEPETMQAGGAPESTGPTEPIRVAPEGPGSDPALEDPRTRTDDFERSGIGDFPGVSTWEVLRGYFANTDGNLDVLGSPEDGVVVAAVDVGSADVRAQVQIDRPASRAGLAFRIVDEQNMFAWVRVPEVGSIILFEVVDGVATPVADSGYVPEGDGMPALGINLVGDRVELLHEGVVVSTHEDLPSADGDTRIGLVLLAGGEGLPLFDELRVLTP